MAKEEPVGKTEVSEVSETPIFLKKDLEAAATELSTVMKFKEPIPVGKKATIKTLTEDIKEAALELEEADIISDKTKAVMDGLGITLPWEVKEPESNIDMPPNLIEAETEEKEKVIEIDKPVKKASKKVNDKNTPDESTVKKSAMSVIREEVTKTPKITLDELKKKIVDAGLKTPKDVSIKMETKKTLKKLIAEGK